MQLFRLASYVQLLTLVLVPHAVADWFTTTTADQAAADSLLGKLREKFGDKIEGMHTTNVRSFFWWEDNVAEEDEVRATFDSDVPFSELREVVEKIHPYEVPMIISIAGGGTLINARERSSPYVMGSFDLNDTTTEEVSSLAKEFVQIRFAACAQVETLEEDEDNQRVTFKTTTQSKEQILREFGGLKFDWTFLRGNQAYLEWLEKSVKIADLHGSEL